MYSIEYIHNQSLLYLSQDDTLDIECVVIYHKMYSIEYIHNQSLLYLMLDCIEQRRCYYIIYVID